MHLEKCLFSFFVLIQRSSTKTQKNWNFYIFLYKTLLFANQRKKVLYVTSPPISIKLVKQKKWDHGLSITEFCLTSLTYVVLPHIKFDQTTIWSGTFQLWPYHYRETGGYIVKYILLYLKTFLGDFAAISNRLSGHTEEVWATLFTMWLHKTALTIRQARLPKPFKINFVSYVTQFSHDWYRISVTVS